MAINNSYTVRPLEFVQAITRDAKTVQPKLILKVHLWFLHLILQNAAEASSDESLGPSLRTMYQTIFTALLQRYVKEPLTRGGVFTRLRVHCGCSECWQLNLFLASATKQIFRFTCGKEDLHHLHSEPDMAGFDGTHETERTYRESQTLVATKRDR